MEEYTLTTVTGTRVAFTGLIALVRADNSRRKEHFNTTGLDFGRNLDVRGHVILSENSVTELADTSLRTRLPRIPSLS